jgi:hypothetical protein
MSRKLLANTLSMIIASLVASFGAQAQDIPRTSWGTPDLNGLWSNGTITPIQRNPGDPEYWTPEQALALEEAVFSNRVENDRFVEGQVGSYNAAFFDLGLKTVPSLRSSLLIDPPDGRFPELTENGRRRQQEARTFLEEHLFDGPETMQLTERCILFGGAAAPMMPEPYNSNYQIVQTPDHVSILAENGYAMRVISLSRDEHFPENVRQWLGDSIGHWEGDTLVVTTDNIKYDQYQSYYGVMYNAPTSDNIRVVERFTRIAEDSIRYQATVTDPDIYSSPWTIETFFAPHEGPMLEYACHEGNVGMFNMLSGARYEESQAADQ